MPTNPAFDAFFKQSAANVANPATAKDPWANYAAAAKTGETISTAAKKANDWNLGQGFIDLLSTGSYAVAGIGNRIGESVSKLQRGDASNVLADLTGIGAITGAVQGVQQRKTWSENLKNLGVGTADAAGWGLGLDIVLDPTWLIPGGAIAKGITGTARGITTAAKLNQVGAKLTSTAVRDVAKATEGFAKPGLRNLSFATPENPLGILKGVIPETGQKISATSPEGLTNFYNGIKQANIENYTQWAADRRLAKMAKVEKKNLKQAGATVGPIALNDIIKATKAVDNVVNDVPADIAHAAPTPDPISNVAEQATTKVEEAVKAQTKAPVVKNTEKDINAAQDAATASLGVKDIKDIAPVAAKELGVARDAYIKANKLDSAKVDLAKIQASTDAPIMSKIYDDLVSDPTNPQVISAYKKLVEETKKQYAYMTKKLGIKITYIQEDPYQLTKADGTKAPNSKAMMRDVIQNKHLFVRDSSIDFVDYPHPILSIEENNLFRAVHDFFGHAASGRNFDANGEEAAWASHSGMFTPEARRAMTTETRGQNSFYNANGRFADQKAALFPEQYTLLPTELDTVTGQIIGTSSVAGRITNALVSMADLVLDDLGLVQTAIKGTKRYSPEQLQSIEKAVSETNLIEKFAPTTPQHQYVIASLNKMIEQLDTPIAKTGFVEKLLTALDETNKEGVSGAAQRLLRQVLEQPVSINKLVADLAAAEGRSLKVPPVFKPTVWGTKGKAYGAVPFTEDKLRSFFPNEQIFDNPDMFEFAMGRGDTKGRVYLRKGETRAQALHRMQETIWEDFRTRNNDVLAKVAEREKFVWDNKNQLIGSELFAKTSAGQLVGVGKMPAALPYAATTGSHDGNVGSTLALMLDHIGQMITRAPNRAVKGTAGTTIIGGKTQNIVAQPMGKQISEFEALSVEDQITRVKDANVRGAEFKIVNYKGEKIDGVVTMIKNGEALPKTAKLVPVNQAAKDVLKSLKKVNPTIEVDRLNPIIQKFMIEELKKAVTKNANKTLLNNASKLSPSDIESEASKLLASGAVKTYADAKLALLGGANAIQELAKIPQTKFYLKDISIKSASKTGGTNAEFKGQLERDPATGLPLDKQGNIVTEREAAQKTITEYKQPQYRLLTDSGENFTGKYRGKPVEQSGMGSQQLAGLQAIRATLANISEGITAKEFTSSPEQAQLLSGVMTQLGIKIAPNASPQQIFKLFQEKAALTFQEVVDGIQSAAKEEAVIYQARAIFSTSINDNLSLMKAIAATAPEEIQQSVVKFTDDAVALVDNYCAMNYARIGGTPLAQSETINKLSLGTSEKIG